MSVTCIPQTHTHMCLCPGKPEHTTTLWNNPPSAQTKLSLAHTHTQPYIQPHTHTHTHTLPIHTHTPCTHARTNLCSRRCRLSGRPCTWRQPTTHTCTHTSLTHTLARTPPRPHTHARTCTLVGADLLERHAHGDVVEEPCGDLLPEAHVVVVVDDERVGQVVEEEEDAASRRSRVRCEGDNWETR